MAQHCSVSIWSWVGQGPSLDPNRQQKLSSTAAIMTTLAFGSNPSLQPPSFSFWLQILHCSLRVLAFGCNSFFAASKLRFLLTVPPLQHPICSFCLRVLHCSLRASVFVHKSFIATSAHQLSVKNLALQTPSISF